MEKTDKVDDWIITALLNNGALRSNLLFQKTREIQVLETLSEHRKWKGYMEHLSKSHFHKRLSHLVKKGVIKKTVESRKNVYYELTDREGSEQWLFGRLVETIDNVLTALNYKAEKPFFGLIETLPNMKKEDLQKLSGFMKNTANTIDRYLTTQV